MHEAQIYTGKHGRARSDKQIERKILLVNMDFFFFFFLSPALFESPYDDRIYSLSTVRRSREGMPQAVKSIRLRNRGCGLIMQKGNLIAVEWKDWTVSTNIFA